MTHNSGIYKIINVTNNRIYIGSSKDIRTRWNEHRRMLKQNKHDNDFLQKSWNKHGEDYFKFEIIEIVEDENLLLEREQHYLDNLKPFNKTVTYNICETAGNMLGFKHSDETKAKLSKQRIGNKNSLGYKHTDETRKKMSNSHTGTNHNEETILKFISISKKNILISKKYNTTKISDVIQNELIEKYNTGLYSTRNLSKLYNVSKSTIWNIVRKR